MFRITCALALAALPAAPAMAAPVAGASQPADIVLYRMARGDNLYTLAEHHLRRPGDYLAVQRLNRIADPRRIPVGTVLRIPKALLRFTALEAQILAFRGAVSIRRDGAEVPIAVGTRTREGDELVTGTNGFVSLGLPDRSTVSLPSQSRVTVQRLRRFSLTGGVDRLFAIGAGRARTVVTPMDATKDDFRFSTPAAVSAVRGTEFRMAYVEGRSTMEVLHGVVDLSTAAARDAQAVEAGFGAVVADGQPPRAVALLPTPTLIDGGHVQDGDALDFAVQALPGAHAYHAQIARDAGFIDAVSETVSPGLAFSLPSVDPGMWFVRVAAFDENGIEGMPVTVSFRRAPRPSGLPVETSKAGEEPEYLFKWTGGMSDHSQYRFQLRKDGDALPMVDEIGLTTSEFTVRNLPPGAYSWRVFTLDSADGTSWQSAMPDEHVTISPEQ